VQRPDGYARPIDGKIRRTAFAGTVRCEVVVCTLVLFPTNGTTIIFSVLRIGRSARFCAILLVPRRNRLLAPQSPRIVGACPATMTTRSAFGPAERGRAAEGPHADRCHSYKRSSARSQNKTAIRAGYSGKNGGAGQAQAVKAGKEAGGLAGAAGSIPAAEERRWRRRFHARTNGR
jgi:hypothetical protein